MYFTSRLNIELNKNIRKFKKINNDVFNLNVT